MMKKAKQQKHKVNLVYVSPEANPEFNHELTREAGSASLVPTDDIVDDDVFIKSGEETIESHLSEKKKNNKVISPK